jgi:hypothetical protein
MREKLLLIHDEKADRDYHLSEERLRRESEMLNSEVVKREIEAKLEIHN